MSDSLRDQLLGLGFKPVPKPEPQTKPRAPARDGDRHARHGRPYARNEPPDAGQRADRHGRPDAGPQARRKRPQDGGRDRPNAAPPARHRRPQDDDRGGRPGSASTSPAPGRPARGGPRSRDDIDLAKAYAIRAQREKDERIAAEQAKQDAARLRREAKAKLAELLKDKALNDPAADIARHFDYGGKIKRIHVTAAQLKALNAGELGVVQLDGRYVLVGSALLAEAEALFSPAIALKIDPAAPPQDDPYADPQYQVPDDLVW